MTTTTTPRRIQRRRTPGWTLAAATTNPLGAVIVDRTSRYGNPFTIQSAIEAEWSNPRRAVTVNFAEWLRVGTEGGWYEETYRIGRQVLDRRRILADLHTLRGRDLACTCPLPEPGQPDHCHGAVLLALANPAPAVLGSRPDTRAQATPEPGCPGLRCADCEPGEECCEARCGCCPEVDAHGHCRLAPGSEDDSRYCDQHGEGWREPISDARRAQSARYVIGRDGVFATLYDRKEQRLVVENATETHCRKVRDRLVAAGATPGPDNGDGA